MQQTPHELADSRITLAADYAFFSEQLEEVLAKKPAVWGTLRAQSKSDKSADRLWEASADGIKEMQLRLRMKAIEKKMSAAKTMLDVLQGESRNNY
jgi:hypothetical protein